MLGAFLAQKTPMASFIEAVGESVNRAACVVLGDFAARLEVLQYILDPLATSPNYNGAAAAYAARCGLPLPPGFTPDTSFTGGQCVGTSYTLTYDYELSTNIATAPPGTYIAQSASLVRNGAILSVSPTNRTNDAGFTIVTSAGSEYIGVASSGFANNVGVRNLSNIQVTPNFGQPDNCGNPPAPVPDYQPGDNTYNTNVTYNDNSGGNVTIPIALAFGYATVNVDGTISIPIRANFELNPELNFNGEFNFSTGDVNFNLGNPSAPRPTGCSDPSGYEPDPSIPEPPTEIPDAPSPDTPPDEPPAPEQVITACIVTTQIPGDNESVIEQDNDVDIYVPALGYVQFKIRAGRSSGWTNDIPVKNRRAFIPCPWAGGAIDVKGTGRYGTTITVTPVLGVSQLSNAFPD